MQIQMTQYLQSIDFTREIPGYSDMSAESRLRYEALYKQAVNPELSPLPEGVSDLEALVYFIFQFNISHIFEKDGKLCLNEHRQPVRIVPFLPMEWTQATGLSMIKMAGPRYQPLLAELEPLRSSVLLYFSVVMLSFALALAAMPHENNYHLLMNLLVAMLDGHYDQTMLNTLKTQSSSLKQPWLVKYLPDPAAITPVDAARVEPARKFLFGDGATRGMFPPPVTPREDRERPSTPAAPSLSKTENSCLIL